MATFRTWAGTILVFCLSLQACPAQVGTSAPKDVLWGKSEGVYVTLGTLVDGSIIHFYIKNNAQRPTEIEVHANDGYTNLLWYIIDHEGTVSCVGMYPFIKGSVFIGSELLKPGDIFEGAFDFGPGIQPADATPAAAGKMPDYAMKDNQDYVIFLRMNDEHKTYIGPGKAEDHFNIASSQAFKVHTSHGRMTLIP